MAIMGPMIVCVAPVEDGQGQPVVLFLRPEQGAWLVFDADAPIQLSRADAGDMQATGWILLTREADMSATLPAFARRVARSRGALPRLVPLTSPQDGSIGVLPNAASPKEAPCPGQRP